MCARLKQIVLGGAGTIFQPPGPNKIVFKSPRKINYAEILNFVGFSVDNWRRYLSVFCKKCIFIIFFFFRLESFFRIVRNVDGFKFYFIIQHKNYRRLPKLINFSTAGGLVSGELFPNITAVVLALLIILKGSFARRWDTIFASLDRADF